jgi:2-oxoglutarate ferredoxin oxidoreductase subunit gamma
MERCRIVFSGSGGQGIVRAAIMLAEAAALHDGLEATQTQAHGPEARGGSTRADVIIADAPIRYPQVIQPNVLVCLSQDAYNRFSGIVRPGGILLSDSRTVEQQSKVDARQIELPMYETVMREIGKPIAFNMCMLGAVVGITRLVRLQSVIKVLETSGPADFLEPNRRALLLGHALGADREP